jgi:hypothetical protein
MLIDYRDRLRGYGSLESLAKVLRILRKNYESTNDTSLSIAKQNVVRVNEREEGGNSLRSIIGDDGEGGWPGHIMVVEQ